MKRFLSFFFLLSFTSITHRVLAQTEQAYEQGNSIIQLGVGLGAPFSTGNVTVPPLQARYEYAVSDEISVGGILGYASSKTSYADVKINYNTLTTSTVNRTINYSYLLFGGRANYHFETSEKLDAYGGATLGYNKIGFDDHGGTIGDYKQSMVLYGAQIGANYYFMPNFAAWAEVGYGLGYLNLGITVKL